MPDLSGNREKAMAQTARRAYKGASPAPSARSATVTANRYAIDAEFYEDGNVIFPISLGLVGDDGREFYCQFDFDWGLVPADHWIQANVRKHLWDKNPKEWELRYLDGLAGGFNFTKAHARQSILRFVGPNPSFYGWYCAYDWVLMAQIHGPMAALPDGWPMMAVDLKTFVPDDVEERLPRPHDLGFQAHHALGDARWTAWLRRKVLSGYFGGLL